MVTSYREADIVKMIPERVTGLNEEITIEIAAEPRQMNKALFYSLWSVMLFGALCIGPCRICIASRCCTEEVSE